MIRAFLFGLVALACALAAPAAARTHLFTDDKPLQLLITAPFRDLVRNAKYSTNSYPATLTVTDGSEAPQSLAIQVRARGLTRRTAGFCDFPPLQLEFGDKGTVHGTVFKGERKLKLVTYCRNASDYEQRIVLEYTAYRLYNLITPLGFRVRAAQVTYRRDASDTGVTRFGYLIEPIEELADRNGKAVLKLATHELKPTQLDPHAAGRAALFEFMISNLDWDFTAGPKGADCCHNSRLIAASDKPPLRAVVPIPYDYDYSGFVDSPYASPPEGLPVTDVTQRYYRGYCISNDEIPAVIEEFRAHRAEMMAIINNETRLEGRIRVKTAKFMDDFFDVVEDPGHVQNRIIKDCR